MRPSHGSAWATAGANRRPARIRSHFMSPSVTAPPRFANGRGEKRKGGAGRSDPGRAPQETPMRPLPSTTPDPAAFRSASPFETPAPGAVEFDDRTLLSLLMARTMAQRD